jgi:signal recognition particle subunit SRP54
MFESLQNGLRAALKTISGKAKLSEANMRDALRLVEQSLLEADVSYSVVNEFLAAVSEQALGQKVLLSLNPDQQLISIVHDELLKVLGPVDSSLHLKPGLTTIMLCGLQGSGKTTTCGKLAQLLIENKKRPMLCAADLQRPAAIDQLHVIGEKLGVPVYSDRTTQDPVKVCQEALKQAKAKEVDVLILDTAGRLAIDEELMRQLQNIDRRVEPDQAYLVVDGMTGQDAVNSASAFNEALELDGVIMTKLDGDARGGALLSVKQVTGVPIKFIGTGEHLDALEPFRPEGMASRILGMGDVVALAREAQKIVDVEQQKELERKLLEGEISLDDFKSHLRQFLQPGLMMKMLGLIPGFGNLQQMMAGGNHEKDMRRMIGIIDAMTPQERRNPKVIDPSRRNRIAKGAGVEAPEVGALVKQFDVMMPMLKSLAGKGTSGRMQALQDMRSQGMFNPGAQMGKMKGDTGKRLTPEEKKRLQKQREKELRKRKRDEKSQRNDPESTDTLR